MRRQVNSPGDLTQFKDRAWGSRRKEHSPRPSQAQAKVVTSFQHELDSWWFQTELSNKHWDYNCGMLLMEMKAIPSETLGVCVCDQKVGRYPLIKAILQAALHVRLQGCLW